MGDLLPGLSSLAALGNFIDHDAVAKPIDGGGRVTTFSEGDMPEECGSGRNKVGDTDGHALGLSTGSPVLPCGPGG